MRFEGRVTLRKEETREKTTWVEATGSTETLPQQSLQGSQVTVFIIHFIIHFMGGLATSAMAQSGVNDGHLHHLLMKKSTNRKAKLPVFF